jgi:hypothetical protein
MSMSLSGRNYTLYIALVLHGGDPANSVYEWGNMLPFLPMNTGEEQRQRQCAKIGCFERTLGMCICQSGFDVQQYATVSDHHKEQCDVELCN